MPKSSIICSPFILVLLFFIATTPSINSSNETDFESLLAFKKAIHDDPLGALSSWNETTHFCRWNGVSCSKRHPNRVVSVLMMSQGIVGTLSPHIGNLSFLRSINLQNNTFRGQIPEEMGRLRRLQVIEFSNNSFGGEIPRNLSQCQNLYYLNLMNNQLTGSIFPEIDSLVNLSVLRLSNNMLSGTIPPSLGNLTSLTIISLVECGLQGEIPESMAQLRRLSLLSLMHNNLSGRIPSSFYNLSDIQTLGLGFNRFIGTIPSHIGFTLPKLRMLSLSSNHFTGPLPASLSNSSQIILINANVNNFTGEMIQVNKLSALQHLGVGYNHLKGDINTIATSLTNSTAIQTIALPGNLFRGSLQDAIIGNLSSHLWGLNIAENELSGSIPSSIGNLLGLTTLSFSDNNLQGRIPSSIGKLHKLQLIYFDANKLTNEIPSSFGNLTLLNELVLYQNDLSGNIPPSLGNCSNLLWLDLSENNLNGSIPPEIMRLSSISISVTLSFNGFTGTIPSEVGHLRNLGTLDLSHNRLSGFIPNSLSSCVVLQWLRLQSNSLQGEIPESMSSLRGLKYLDLSQNNISGTIPRFLVELHLENLNISFNALHGEVPAIGVFQNESAVSLEGNQQLCGGIATLNLPSCSPTSSKKKGFRKILIPTAGAICLAALSAFFCIVMYMRRKSSQRTQTSAALFQAPEFLRLSYADLVNATGGFLETNLVGVGNFGSVYRGSVIINDEQTDVAVKVLNLNERGASRSLESECNALRDIRHRNLVKILSVCDSINFQGEDFKALVYEFMANGSLDNWLHQNSDEEVGILGTIQRLNIAIDIAYGVEYLHSGTTSKLVMSMKSVTGKSSSLLRLVEERMKLKQELEENKKKQQKNKEPQVDLVAVPYLPKDCISSIIVRLPLESLLASRFICKSWYGIVNSPAFIDAHLQRSNNGLIYLTPAVKGQLSSDVGTASGSSAMKIDYNVDAKVLELDTIPILHWHLFNPRTQYQIKYLEIKDAQSTIKEYNATCTGNIKAVCNGLIVLENLTRSRGLIIMNPVTRELKTIPLGTMSSPHRESYGLAFFHELSCYKLVHLFQDDSRYIGCEIMNVGSGPWRVVDGPCHGIMGWLGYQPVFAIGALHWVPRVDHNEYIVSMSLIDEKFQNIPLPNTGGIHDRILEMGGVLGFVSRNSANQIDVWTLKSLGGEGWAKQHSITMDCMRDMVPLYCVRAGGELVFKKGNDLYAYDQHLQLMRKIEVNNEWCRSPGCYFPHVNSLISWRIEPKDEKYGNH